MFFMAQRRAFARGPDRHQPVRALFNMPFDQLFQRIQINCAVLERRDEGGE